MLLVVNAGSSSVKLALFEAGQLRRAHTVSQLGQGGYRAALVQGLAALGHPQIAAAAHRVVHGGAQLTQTLRLTPDVLAKISAAAALAPLHNPANLACIAALTEGRPNLPQFAAFDTAFHATIPSVEHGYAIPKSEGLRRYGFHGLSYASMVRRLRPDLPRRLLGFHLGNGASICAIVDGQSRATTMGYSPQDGLAMGTRAGSIDSAAVLELARRHGIDGAEELLNRASGLMALSGKSDMRLQTAGARAYFIHHAVRHAGALVAVMGGLDAVVFSGGIGENDAAVRAGIMNGLAYLGLRYRGNDTGDLRGVGLISAQILPAEEERQIALEVGALL
jgi:acetate kinase